MSGLKTVSRSQLYDDDEDVNLNDSSDNENTQEYNLPPPGFDFEIVDVEDNIEEEATQDKPEDVEEEKEKVEFFPLFSTSTTTKDADSKDAPALVKVKMDIDNDDEEEIDELTTDKSKLKDAEWDRIVQDLNAEKRTLEYYYKNTDNDTSEEIEKFRAAAVDGTTVYEWNEKFRILTDHKVIDLKEYNAKIDLYYSIPKIPKSKKRGGKKKRDAKIFKKERLRTWKLKLKEAKERSKQKVYKDHSTEATTSTKTKFGDSFKKRNTVSKGSISSKPGKPVFRTE